MREGECELDRCSQKGTAEEKGILYPGKSSTQWKDQPNQRNLQMQRSVAVSWSSEKQSENQTDHLNYGHSHQKLRRLGGGWAPRPQLQRLVPGKGLGGAGWNRDGLGGLETSLSSLTGQRLPGRLESRALAVAGTVSLRVEHGGGPGFYPNCMEGPC